MSASEIETRSGRIAGERFAHGVRFLGIPYAAPPVGRLRFAPPQRPEPWSGVRACTSFGPDAPQLPSLLETGPPWRQDEDCLTLNVWTPALDDDGGRPVAVWIHGGGFATGGAQRAIYDGARLCARGDLVVVSLSYRLGVLGLAAHPELWSDDAEPGSNACLQDQIAALSWVREHAALLGGDPDEVTVFGESAGGASAALLATSPLARGLFRRAIVQSSSPLPIAAEQAWEATERLCHELECKPAALRGLPVETLLGAQEAWAAVQGRGRTAPRPWIDGRVLERWPGDACASGATRSLELTVGSNRDEFALFALADPRRNDFSADDLRRRLDATLAADVDTRACIDAYRSARAARGEPDDPWSLWIAIQSDRLIRVPSLQWLDAHVRAGGRGAAYLFTQASALPGLGACHALEVPYVFGTLDAPGFDRLTGRGAELDALSDEMQAAWIERIAGHDTWPAWSPDARTTRIFGPDGGAAGDPRGPERAFWGELIR